MLVINFSGKKMFPRAWKTRKAKEIQRKCNCSPRPTVNLFVNSCGRIFTYGRICLICHYRDNHIISNSPKLFEMWPFCCPPSTKLKFLLLFYLFWSWPSRHAAPCWMHLWKSAWEEILPLHSLQTNSGHKHDHQTCPELWPHLLLLCK